MAVAIGPRMVLDPRKLLFRTRGRLDRPSFAAALVALLVAFFIGGVVMRLLDPATAPGFFFGLFFGIASLFMIYSVFGQRLHDMGFSVWPLTGLLFVLFLIFLGVAMAYGGVEYFEAYSQFERKEAIDPEVVRALDEAYQERLAQGGSRTLGLLMSGAIGLFTVWLLLARGDEGANRYGPEPT